ncbi:MAG: CHASE domain-containing protein [Longispora sp.]|nr:CHASE domain-containing protein [Longispora sp. (in: high G+C Gram-positive bacteria)]
MRLERFARSAVLLSVLVVVIGLAVSTAVAQTLAHGQRSAAEDQLKQRSALVAEAVSTETMRYVDALRITAAAATVEPLTAARFAQVAEPLREMGLAGATSLGFQVAVSDDQVISVQETWRSRGAADLTFSPVGTGRPHIFSVFSVPLDGGPPAVVGTDTSQIPAPLEAMTQARETDQVTVSDAYQLLRDPGMRAHRQQLAFILTAPIFEHSDNGDRGDFVGWVLMGLRSQDFIGATLERVAQDLVDVTLLAQNFNDELVTVATQRAQTQGVRDLRYNIDITVAQRRWRLDIEAAGGALPGVNTGFPVAAALSGAVLSLLLAGLVYVLATGRSRAQIQVREATSQLRKTEAAARRQADLLEAVMVSISEGVSVIGSNGGVLLHNPAAKRILGVGDTVSDPRAWHTHFGIYRPDGATPFPVEEQPLVRALDGEPSDNVEMVIRNASHPSGVRIEVSGRPLDPKARQHGAVAVFRDVTVQRAQEAELAAFAGVVAHDLRTPLAVVAGYAEFMTEVIESESIDPEDLHTALDNITIGVQRMRDLIQNLLAYATARDAPLDPAAIDLGPIAAEVISTHTARLRGTCPDLVPAVTLEPMPKVLADPTMVRQLLDNLVGNAVKYTELARPAEVEISARPDRPGWIRVEVSDRGVGIPAGQHRAIFSGFHRAHSGQQYSGTGLGLAICQRIVDRHGGVIGAVDNPGGGSRFSFTLPVADRVMAVTG